MDQTVVNGAQIFFGPQFGIDPNSNRGSWLLGLVNSAPYVMNEVFTPSRELLMLLIRLSVMLCLYRMLAHGTTERTSRSPRSDLRYRNHFLVGVFLARGDQLVASSIRRSICAGPWNWAQIRDCSSIWS